jgi:hypothetical protein
VVGHMIIYVDIDNTICQTSGTNYENSVPLAERIAEINKLFNAGNFIVYWTGRGSGSGKDWSDLTRTQLKEWGVKYHKLLFGKPVYDLFIDDKSISSESFF